LCGGIKTHPALASLFWYTFERTIETCDRREQARRGLCGEWLVEVRNWVVVLTHLPHDLCFAANFRVNGCCFVKELGFYATDLS
jgi:hypothetical protein